MLMLHVDNDSIGDGGGKLLNCNNGCIVFIRNQAVHITLPTQSGVIVVHVQFREATVAR